MTDANRRKYGELARAEMAGPAEAGSSAREDAAWGAKREKVMRKESDEDVSLGGGGGASHRVNPLGEKIGTNEDDEKERRGVRSAALC